MTRTGLIARVTVPPVAGFVLVALYVAAEALGFRALAQPEAATVSEAAALGEAARALQLIAAGQDVNARLLVRGGFLDHDSHELMPLEAAILGRHAELVRLLQRSGATHSDRARTACFARLRLPEVLGDLGAPDASPLDPAPDVTATIKTCSANGTPL